jgi:hypothetical protein
VDDGDSPTMIVAVVGVVGAGEVESVPFKMRAAASMDRAF